MVDDAAKQGIAGKSQPAAVRLRRDPAELVQVERLLALPEACRRRGEFGVPEGGGSQVQQRLPAIAGQVIRLNFRNVGPLEGFIGASAFNARNGMNFDLGYDERAMALMFSGTLQSFAPRGLTNAQINALLGPMAAMLKPFMLDRQITTADINTYDLFADFTAHLGERLELFAGGRITWDSKDVALQGLNPLGPSNLTGAGILLQPTPGGAILRGKDSSTILTGRAGARFKLTPDVNLFVAYGIGKRPETLQLNPTRPADLIPEERLDSVEGGIKFRLLDGRVVGDATIFHYDYQNFQTQGLVNGRLATVNAGKADATGFETQVNVALTPEVSIFGSYGYNKARLHSGAFSGNHFRNSPDHKFAIGADVTLPMKGGSISFAPLYSWQSKMYFFDDNDRLDLQQRVPAALSDKVVDEFQDGFGLLSARLTFKGTDDRWTFALVGDNLTDKKFIVDAGNTGDYFGIPTFIAGSRRTYRAEFGVKF